MSALACPAGFSISRPLVRAYAVDREAAILSAGSAEADPLVLARSYVAVAKKHGAAFFDAEAVSYNSTKTGVAVGLDTGATVEAAYVVLATGIFAARARALDASHGVVDLCYRHAAAAGCLLA